MNSDNVAAQRLYEKQGFVHERAWRIWRRGGFLPPPVYQDAGFRVSEIRRGQWKAELALAQAARPNALGGMGWLKPVHSAAFLPPLWKRLLNMISLNGLQRLVIRDEISRDILASCWLESAMSAGSVRGWLFASPQVETRPCMEALINNVVHRHERAAIQFEHPRDDEAVNELLRGYQFKVTRELCHMRLDL